MFARDVEGRIGMDAGFGGVRDQTSCPGDFPPLLPPGAGAGAGVGAGPRPCTAAGRGTLGPTADRASELRK